MTIPAFTYGGGDPAEIMQNLVRDLNRLDAETNQVYGVTVVDPIVTAETTNVSGRLLYVVPAADIAAHTFRFPAAPENNQMHTIKSAQAIAAITWSVASPGDATFVDAPSAFTDNASATFIYSSATNKWYKI